MKRDLDVVVRYIPLERLRIGMMVQILLIKEG